MALHGHKKKKDRESNVEKEVSNYRVEQENIK